MLMTDFLTLFSFSGYYSPIINELFVAKADI